MSLQFKYFHSNKDNSFELLISQVNEKKLLENTPVFLTFFMQCDNYKDYQKNFKSIKTSLEQLNLKVLFILVSQQPFKNKISLEVLYLKKTNIRKINSGAGYSIYRLQDTELLIANTNGYTDDSFENNATSSLTELKSILNTTGFEFSDIVRQWNYIENILNISDNITALNQNYQVFNNLRSSFYNESEFTDGYPAATGIGTTTGGCGISIMAVKGEKNKILAIKNNEQIDAHQYSEDVLIGSSNSEDLESPKFERAKFLATPLFNILLISGTASIEGEATVHKANIELQTLSTIRNINLLVQSVKKDKKPSEPKLLNYRAYVKKHVDCLTVEKLCIEHFKSASGIVLVADICRDDLLVEIECNYTFE